MRCLADGFGYLEGLRWHRGALWFSDIKQRQVVRMSVDGRVERTWAVPARPSGLGFTRAGAVLVVSMEDARLVRLEGDAQHTVARLGALAAHPNDMVVDASGRAYISQFGYDLFGGAEPRPCGVVVVEPGGGARIEGGGLTFPNGLGITADGGTLIVAESFGYRLSAFPVESRGGLGARRDFAVFDDPARDVLDGLCVDAEDGVWVACPFAGEFRRVVEGGEVTDRLSPGEGGDYCVACTLGGADGRTLFMAVADTDVERLADDWDSSARIMTADVTVPGIAR
ncbi:MAG: SMP-30/gluconolactonase/LRE family protein [Gammaproteobacteria bacterium]